MEFAGDAAGGKVDFDIDEIRLNPIDGGRPCFEKNGDFVLGNWRTRRAKLV